MPPDLSPSSVSEFWRWFAANSDDLFHFERDREPVFNRLSAALKKVDPDLTFELSSLKADGTREFIISAGGLKSAFPGVLALHAAAPDLPRWSFLAFRQRMPSLCDLQFGEHKVRADDVHYLLFKDENPEKAGIAIFLNGYSKADHGTWGQIGYLFLDQALGEYDVETHVGGIVFENRDSQYFQHARPLAELPAHMDRFLGRTPG